ncbi:MAG: CDP-alcohol phosphatidyltransferase family protein [Hyphomicrobiaceae bacterium]
MASLYDIKPRFQALLRPRVEQLAEAGVTANEVTLAALGLSLAEGVLLYLFAGATLPLLLLPVVLLVRMALNAVDGMLAREHDQASKLGLFLNELSDMVSDAALYLPLALHPDFSGLLVAGIVVLALVGEAAGLAAQSIGASRRYDGPMGKSDRALAFGALGTFSALGLIGWTFVAVALALMAVLLCLTIWNRVRGALAEIGEA